MDRQTLLKKIAPCGMLCFTCAVAKDGVIKQHGRALLRHLEGFGVLAERMSAFEPRLKKYRDFYEVLQMMDEAGCEGCRDGVAKFPGCQIPSCARELGVDFCFECESFPCDKADFEPRLKAKWLRANERMREIGPEAYFEEESVRSHYL
jgi:hypothetical protein